MTIPQISAFPDAPSRSDNPDVFVQKADDFVEHQATTFVSEMNAAITAFNRALGKEPVFFEFDAVTSQTAFNLPAGYTIKAVYSAGTLKRIGSTKDYTTAFDGFKETVNFAVAPGNTVWVSIMCVRT
jgi:hypothetical protein